MLIHPNFDPIAISLGPVAVRWYGLMYLAAFASGWWLGRRRIAQGLAPVTREQFDDLLFGAVLGIILGGRLGYVLFYKPAHYLSHPLEVLYIWQGGMAFHGGFLGVLVAMAIVMGGVQGAMRRIVPRFGEARLKNAAGGTPGGRERGGDDARRDRRDRRAPPRSCAQGADGGEGPPCADRSR